MSELDRERLRISFVTYGGMNRKDLRTVSIEDLNFEPSELTRLLIPTLDARSIQSKGVSSEYGVWLLEECRKGLSIVLPLSDAELEFLDLLLDKGQNDATILTSDKTLRKSIQNQPLLEWKALNVRRHKGLV